MIDFTRIDMTETLKSNNLTVVETVMPNQKYLPVEVTKKGGCLVGSAIFPFKDYLAMGYKKEQACPFCHQLLINLT